MVVVVLLYSTTCTCSYFLAVFSIFLLYCLFLLFCCRFILLCSLFLRPCYPFLLPSVFSSYFFSPALLSFLPFCCIFCPFLLFLTLPCCSLVSSKYNIIIWLFPFCFISVLLIAILLPVLCHFHLFQVLLLNTTPQLSFIGLFS